MKKKDLGWPNEMAASSRVAEWVPRGGIRKMGMDGQSEEIRGKRMGSGSAVGGQRDKPSSCSGGPKQAVHGGSKVRILNIRFKKVWL